MSVLGTSSLSAQIRGNNIVVTVTPDHQDWNYRVGEKANFTVNVRKSGTLLNQVKVDYEAGPAMFPEVKKSTTLKDGTMKWCGSLNRPGFYRLKVIAHVDGKDYEGLCTAGFSPEKIQPFAQEPKDFNAFWKKVLDEARQNDLNPTKVLLPERCTKDKNVSSNPQPIGFSGILLAKRQNSFYCTYFLHNRNVADTKSPYPIKRLEVIRWFNQKSMVFNQSLS